MAAAALSEIPQSGTPPASTDFLVGVTAANQDRLFSASTIPFLAAGSNLNFYVATTGSDSNPGTLAQPFATIQRAVNVAAKYDYANAFFPIINVSAGTYNLAAIIILPALRNVILTNFPSGGRIVGDPTTPANVILDGGSASPPGHFVHPASGTAWSVSGFQLQNATTGTAINVNNGAAILNVDNINFVNNLRHFKAFAGGQIYCGFNTFQLSFQGSGAGISLAQVASQIVDFGCVWTFVGAQNFSDAVFHATEAATIDANFFSTIGAGGITGKRYNIDRNAVLGVLNAADRSQFPGSLVGGKDPTAIIEQDPFYNIYTPLSGTTVTTTPGEPKSILNPAGTLATLTVNPATNFDDGETWSLASSQTITALTLATTDGSSLVGAPTTLPANSGFTMVFNANNNTWYMSD